MLRATRSALTSNAAKWAGKELKRRNMSQLRCALIAVFLLLSPTALLHACPFCNAVQPSFAERRADADALLLAEAVGDGTFAVRQVFDGAARLGKPTTIEADDSDLPEGQLVLLLGRYDADAASEPWNWLSEPVDEASLAYYVRAPSVKLPSAERLRYFVKYLEHADADIAEDAFREFGRAPFEAVAAVADGLPYAKMRAWLVDAAVPGERKGFYGMALGLAPSGAERDADRALLRQTVVAPAGEFRAGFDGILGGYLLVDGTAALDLIDERILRNPQAAEGDVRHAQAALRFYLQYGREVPEARLIASVASLLDRPATAPGALQDLTRRRAWGYTARAEALFLQSSGDDPALDRAVVGYLLLCPDVSAAAALRKLKSAAPERTAAALRHAELLGIRSE
ncbi:MAG: hypothetical protein C0483_25745 [Pirellula sp.]|nr:hypothetical protein [Pirellula sp.]